MLMLPRRGSQCPQWVESGHQRVTNTPVKWLFHRSAMVGLLGVVGLTSMPLAARETITVSRRPWFAICAGVCPYYDVTVRPDGHVLVKRGNFEERFRVSPAEAADFFSKLRPFRPAGEEPDQLICVHDGRPEDAPLVMKVREIEIKWSDTRHAARLTACDNSVYADLIEAIRQALWSVHLYVDGRRRD
jgi:hypothetical protein